MPPIPPKLTEFYQSTSYRARTSRGELTLRIGERSELLDRLLDDCEVSEWAYLTSCNPHSQRLTDKENSARVQELRDLLDSGGWPYFSGSSCADEGDWPDEESVLILGVSLNTALKIGSQFGQYAIIAGIRGGPAILFEAPSQVAD